MALKLKPIDLENITKEEFEIPKTKNTFVLKRKCQKLACLRKKWSLLHEKVVGDIEV